MRTKFILFFIFFTSLKAISQNGYIKMADSDSAIVGYLRYFTGHINGQTGIEFWKTKKDKKPFKVVYSQLSEYAIKKDTFKILHMFKPFPDSNEYYEYVKAKLISRGKVNLYIIPSGYITSQGVAGSTGISIPMSINLFPEKKEYAYLLEVEKIEYQRALPYPREDLVEVLKIFFPPRYLERYVEEKGVIRYNDVPDLVKLYNSK